MRSQSSKQSYAQKPEARRATPWFLAFVVSVQGGNPSIAILGPERSFTPGTACPGEFCTASRRSQQSFERDNTTTTRNSAMADGIYRLHRKKKSELSHCSTLFCPPGRFWAHMGRMGRMRQGDSQVNPDWKARNREVLLERSRVDPQRCLPRLAGLDSS